MNLKYIKEFDLNVPSWNEILKNFDNSVLNNEQVKHNCLGFFASFNAHRIKKVKKIMKKLNAIDAHMYINITKKGDTYGNHYDDVNVYYWQCQGQTKWIFNESNQQFLLSKGDLIIVPKGTYHNVIPLTPRVGVSMS